MDNTTYSELVTTLPLPAIVIDDRQMIMDANNEFGRIVAKSTDEIEFKTIKSLYEEGLFSDDVSKKIEKCIEVLENNDASSYPFNMEIEVDEKNTARYEGRLGQTPKDVYICTFHDLSSIKQASDMVFSLYESMRDLYTADTKREVAQITAEAASDIIGFDGTSVRFYDPDTDELRLVALGSTVGDIEDRPNYKIHETPHGRAFTEQRTVIEGIEQNEDDELDRDAFVKVLYTPIGEKGTLSAGKSKGEITETERHFAEILAKQAEAALELAEHIAQIQDRNERMDTASSILTHDLRNQLTIASGYVETFEDTPNKPHASTALDRIKEIVNDLNLIMSRGRDPQIAPIDNLDRTITEAVREAQIDNCEVDLQVNGDPTIRADAVLLRRLIVAVIENAIEEKSGSVNIEIEPTNADESFKIRVDSDILAEGVELGHGHGTTTEGSTFNAATIGVIANIHHWDIKTERAENETEICFQKVA